MGKQLKGKQIFSSISYSKPFSWKDIKHIDFQDDDVIRSEWVDAYYSENNSYDAHWAMIVIRKVYETEEEYQERLKRQELYKAQSKEKRKERYLELKKEFEDGIPISGGEESENQEEA